MWGHSLNLPIAIIACIAIFSASTSHAADTSEVARGRYLARVGDCTSCHTANVHKPFAGGVVVGTPFGTLVAPNITPDPATGIGDWTEEQFYRALHDGINAKGEYMYPAMPYTFFTKVTRADVDAIYAYLRSLKPIHNKVDINHLRFPFDIRYSMMAWRMLYFDEGTYKDNPDRSAVWNRGAYLVEGLGHCAACHSPRNFMGGIEQSRAFTGAPVDGWFALNLTSEFATGLGSWNIPQIEAYLKTGAAKGVSTTLGPMAEVHHNSLQYLTVSDLDAIATYLKNLPPNAPLYKGYGVVDPTRQAGATLFMNHCSACHQSDGRGIPGIFPPLAGNNVVKAAEPVDILNVVVHGIPARNRRIEMPAFGHELSATEIAEVANFVRTSWGNDAPPNATPAEVKTIANEGD